MSININKITSRKKFLFIALLLLYFSFGFTFLANAAALDNVPVNQTIRQNDSKLVGSVENKSSKSTKNLINLYFFYGDGCPHCAQEEILLNQLEKEAGNIKINRYEIWHDQENARLLTKISEVLKINASGVPVLVIGEKIVAGYYNDETTGQSIRQIIKDYTVSGCQDVVDRIIKGEKVDIGNKSASASGASCSNEQASQTCQEQASCTADSDKTKEGIPEKLKLPLVGELNLKRISLPLITMIIGLVDGFNPCALWTLIFLISLLLSMNDRKRMIALGTAYLISSATVYFIFMAAWLNFFVFIGFVFWLRTIIALVAIGSGVYSFKKFWDSRDGTCHVTNNEKRKAVFDRIRRVVMQKQLGLALAGMILLAAAVNLVKFICTAGLPAVYIQILAVSKVTVFQHYMYIAFYTFMYILQEIIVFIIAITTMKIKALSSKYARWSALIGGILMLIIGLLLILRPNWIMFG